jgi:uncharacterized protein (TIGR00369 family)
MSVTTDDPITITTDNCHSQCILCGRQNAQSLHLSFHPAGDGAVRTRFEVHPELQGYDGLLHGGVIAALLDEVMTHCLFHHGVQAVTGDLHVRFVRAVPCDVPLEIRARMLSASPPLYRLRAEIVADERVMAWAEAKFMRRRTHSFSGALRPG